MGPWCAGALLILSLAAAGPIRAQGKSTEHGAVRDVLHTCGMAHWGVAMSWLGNPQAALPSARGLKEGGAAVDRAKTAGARTDREREYIAAIENVYKDAERMDHRTRALAYEKAMEQLGARYPADREAAVFYALALNVTLDPNPRGKDADADRPEIKKARSFTATK